MISNSQLLSAILSNAQLFSAILSNSQLFSAILSNSQQFSAILSYSQQFSVILNNTQWSSINPISYLKKYIARFAHNIFKMRYFLSVQSVRFFLERHLTFKKVQTIKNCTILKNSKWKCLGNQMIKSTQCCASLYVFFLSESQFSTLLASFAHIFLCMSRIEVNELSLLKKGGVGRPLLPRRKNVLRKRAVMALPVGSHEGSLGRSFWAPYAI